MPSISASSHRVPRAQQWRENSTLTVTVEAPEERREYYTEREEEEYYYIHQRAPSEASQSATVTFPTDDRLEEEPRPAVGSVRIQRPEQRYSDSQVSLNLAW